ncbi:hypothetical protein GCM10027051_03860 [Niabella terrae]
MKKTVLIAVGLALFTVSASYAQDAPPPTKEKKEQRARRDGRGNPYESLNLTQDQKDKVKAYNEEQKKKMDAIRDDASLSDDQKREKRMELMKAGRTHMESLLTPEQKEKWKAMRKERAKERGQRGNRRSANNN